MGTKHRQGETGKTSRRILPDGPREVVNRLYQGKPCVAGVKSKNKLVRYTIPETLLRADENFLALMVATYVQPAPEPVQIEQPKVAKPRREAAPKPPVIPWKLEDFVVEPQEGKVRFHDFKLAPI